ncbi:Scarecrow-like protein 14 [Bienertia sinuspersici]
MDSQLEELYGTLHRIKFNDHKVPILASDNTVNSLTIQDTTSSTSPNPPLNPQIPNFNFIVPSIGQDNESAIHEDYDFNDDVLNYIKQVLMEEDEEEKTRQHHEPSALEAAEKTLYEVIGKQYPSQIDQYRLPDVNKLHNWNNSDGVSSSITDDYSGASSSSGVSRYIAYKNNPIPLVDFSVPSSNLSLPSSYSSASNSINFGDASADSPVSALSVSDLFNDSQSMLQFQKGVEEANKFLPKGLVNNGFFQTRAHYNSAVNLESRHENEITSQLSGKKNRGRDEFLPEERIGGNKLSSVSHISDEAVMRSEMFDKVLLCNGGKNDADLREALQNGLNKSIQETQKGSSSSSGRGRGRRRGNKREVIDLRSLLTLCAQAVGTNDQRNANDLLRQIRQHSSSNGDGNQRLAHYFADGLEARLAGVGTPIYCCLLTGPASAVDILRAYHMFLAICPFKKIGNFFCNRTVSKVVENARRLHIIDIGIVYGFQWPCLFQRLASRPGGPPEIRITGVDLPQPGFRPTKRLEETGRRLKNYAESFNIPFEFNAVAKKWETVTKQDLKIDGDEVLVVNCLFRFKYVPEETAMVECPRDMLLNLIREIKPDVFIQGVVNGAFNSPFFITRFREALFHFSTLFDMLETNLPRDLQERILIEREIFGRQAMNVIACEGLERIERPETYKQWQVRIERAGFSQLPLNTELVSMAKKRVKTIYHKDYSIDEDGHWLLQGWKGRIVYALTIWKPVYEDHLSPNYG